MDAGGFTGNQSATWEARALFLVEVMKRQGYDAATLGEEDLRLPAEILRSLAAPDGIFVSANLRAAGGSLLLPSSRIVERAGIRVGITAVTRKPPADTTHTAEVDFAESVPSLEPVLARLRRDADLVVLLAHMPLEAAQALGEDLAGQVDVVVVGSAAMGRGRTLAEHGGAVYVVAGDRGQALGVAQVAVENGDVLGIAAEEAVLDRDTAEDPDTAELVDVFQRNLNDLMKEQAVAKAQERRAADGHWYVGAESCAGCHEREYGLWLETPHSSAFQTLEIAGTEALPECFGCHVTGHGDPAGYSPHAQGSPALVNVQCEVCHGKGTTHARDGSYGAALLMNSCRGCHDAENSPDFDPEVYWRMIEH
ncbi:MAG: multiheme c-type cytochrome [Candidatus Eiseniibacteriota bacterium]